MNLKSEKKLSHRMPLEKMDSKDLCKGLGSPPPILTFQLINFLFCFIIVELNYKDVIKAI